MSTWLLVASGRPELSAPQLTMRVRALQIATLVASYDEEPRGKGSLLMSSRMYTMLK